MIEIDGYRIVDKDTLNEFLRSIEEDTIRYYSKYVDFFTELFELDNRITEDVHNRTSNDIYPLIILSKVYDGFSDYLSPPYDFYDYKMEIRVISSEKGCYTQFKDYLLVDKLSKIYLENFRFIRDRF